MENRIRPPVEMAEVMPVFLLAASGLIVKSGIEPFTISKDVTINSEGAYEPIKDYLLPKWLQQNAEFGFLGEKIAYSFLKKRYKSTRWVSLQSSRYGYDIKADDQLFEIKTSHAKGGFEITSRELTVAKRFCEAYWIFFIVLNEQSKSATGYLIRDPLAQLEIDVDSLCRPVETGKAVLEPDRFSVTIEDFIDTMEGIELSDIYQMVTDQDHHLEK